MKKALLLVIAGLLLTAGTGLCREGKLVSLGDSIARGYRLEDRINQRYSAIAARELGMKEVNLAVNGQRADECLEWLTAHRRETEGAEAVLLSMGANHALPLMFGLEGDAEQCLEEFGEQLDALLAGIAEIAPEAKKVMLTFYDPIENEDSAEICAALNDIIYRLSGVYGFGVADAEAAFRGRTGELLMEGDIHPSAEGHRVLADLVTEALRDDQ